MEARPLETMPAWFMDRARLRELADQHRASFAGALPFPHVVVDDFLPPWLADDVAQAFPRADLPGFKRVEHAEQAGRLGHLQRRGFDGVAPILRHLLNELCGMAFLDFVGFLTGIEGLVPDPHYRGAAIHVTLPGGHLDLHADHNTDRFRKLQRRVTVLLYFNPGWEDAWGGHLELWPRDLSACGARIAPVHNRCVVMVHRSDAWHGHPQPLACPADRARNSIAAYFYAVDRPAEETRDAHPAIWVKPA